MGGTVGPADRFDLPTRRLRRAAGAAHAAACAALQEPTQAELQPGMQVLVVSQETTVGGEAINAGRRERGMQPLALLVVSLVGGDVKSKLSSTALREAEAVAGRQAQVQAPQAGSV